MFLRVRNARQISRLGELYRPEVAAVKFQEHVSACPLRPASIR
jgi:hypothetical protein